MRCTSLQRDDRYGILSRHHVISAELAGTGDIHRYGFVFREAEIFREIASMPLAKMHFDNKALQGIVSRGEVINEIEDRLKAKYGLNDDFNIFGISYLDENNH